MQSPLTELRIRSNGRDVIVERAGVQLEPISGQIMLNFETRELTEKVRMMPQRSANDWVALGVKREEQSASDAGPRLAAEAYRSALETDQSNVDALNNLGTLSYEEGNLEDAIALFRHAVELHPDHMLSHFNLGSALEELGHDEQARRHLRRAVQLNPEHADVRSFPSRFSRFANKLAGASGTAIKNQRRAVSFYYSRGVAVPKMACEIGIIDGRIRRNRCAATWGGMPADPRARSAGLARRCNKIARDLGRW